MTAQVKNDAAAERFPREPGASQHAHERAVRAKALDLARGLLPAATLSHVGIFASAQTFERLVLHLRAEELPTGRLIVRVSRHLAARDRRSDSRHFRS